MSGQEFVGYRLANGKIRYTNWGQLSLQILLSGAKGQAGVRVNLNQVGTPSAHEQLIAAINKDVKGEVSPAAFIRLDDADCHWLITTKGHLYDPKRHRYLTW